MERKEDLEEIIERQAKKLIEKRTDKIDSEAEKHDSKRAMATRKNRDFLQSQDPVARVSEVVGLIEDGTANVIKLMAKSKIKDLEKAPETLRTMAAAFAELGEAYDRDVTPLAIQVISKRCFTESGMGGV